MKPSVSIIHVTKRWGGLDVLVDSLGRQTVLPQMVADNRIDMVMVDEHAQDPKRREAVEKLHAKIGMPILLAYPPDPEEPTYSKLELSNNLALKHAAGDVLFFLNDNMVLSPNCLEVMLDTLNTLPYNALITTICHHASRPTLDDVADLQGPYTIFRKEFVAEDYGYPDFAASWTDPRVDQEAVSTDPYRWEANVAMATSETISRAGGFDPAYDAIGFGGDNVALAASAMLATPGTQVVIVKSLISWSLPHYTLQPNPESQKGAEARNQLILKAYLKGVMDTQNAMGMR